MDKPDSSAFLSLLLQSSFMGQRVICSNTEWENYSQKQMHLIFQEGLDSAYTCIWSNLHELVMCLKTPRLIYSMFFCWLSSGDTSHVCADLFVDTAREFQLSARSLMVEDQMYQKLDIFPTPNVD